MSDHQSQPLVQFFVAGLTEGFRVGFEHSSMVRLKSTKKNLQGALLHPEVIDDYLAKEIALNRVVGPFKRHELPPIHVSRFGVIPKNHQKDKANKIGA